MSEQELHSRECVDALGRVANIPDFDKSSGDGENKTRSIPKNKKNSKLGQTKLGREH